tara:strand:- start:450 stop:749 length:300 start_codon:yes stop_codon:yes gene_type:complete
MADEKRLLTFSEVEAFSSNHSSWTINDNVMTKEFKFNTYMEGILFVNRLAEYAESLDHHPDLEVGWCKVVVNYTTHDLGGLSTFDTHMAILTDKAFNSN